MSGAVTIPYTIWGGVLPPIALRPLVGPMRYAGAVRYPHAKIYINISVVYRRIRTNTL